MVVNGRGALTFLTLLLLFSTTNAVILDIKLPTNDQPFQLGLKSVIGKIGVQEFVNVTGQLIFAYSGCDSVDVTSIDCESCIMLMQRGSCDFYTKGLNAQDAGAIGMIMIFTGNYFEDNHYVIQEFPEYADTPLNIPAVFINGRDHLTVRTYINESAEIWAILSHEYSDASSTDSNGLSESQKRRAHMPSSLHFIGMVLIMPPLIWSVLFGIYLTRRRCLRREMRRLRAANVRSVPTKTYRESKESDDQKICHNTACAICLEDFETGESIKVLPCEHGFHGACIDPWINDRSDLCPICKRSILTMSPEVKSNVLCCDRFKLFLRMQQSSRESKENLPLQSVTPANLGNATEVDIGEDAKTMADDNNNERRRTLSISTSSLQNGDMETV